MLLLGLAKSRKTVRKFKTFVVPDITDILYAIEVAKEAPSGMNDQPWLFYIVRRPELKQKIRAECEKAEKGFYDRVKGRMNDWLKEQGFSWQKEFLTQAPYLVLVFSNKRSPFSKESVWLAIGYFLLALEEKKLATVTYTPSNLDNITKLLDISKDFKLEVILPVGYSDDPKPKYERKDLNKIVLIDNEKGLG